MSFHYLVACFMWVLVSSSSLEPGHSGPVSTFRKYSYLPSSLELLCSRVQGSTRPSGGRGRLSHISMSTNPISKRHLVLIDETYSQLHQGGLVSSNSCRWPWPSLQLSPLSDFWTSNDNCRRAILQPLDGRRLGLALITEDEQAISKAAISVDLFVLDAMNCTWTKLGKLNRREERFPGNLDLHESLWILARGNKAASTALDVLFSTKEWQPTGSCDEGDLALCRLSFNAVTGESLDEPRVLQLGSIKTTSFTGLKLLPVRSDATASLGGGYIILVLTKDELVIRVFDSRGGLASWANESKPRGSLQLLIQANSDEDREKVEDENELGPILRYCWLTTEGRAECKARGPALDSRSNVSFPLGHEGADSGTLLEMPGGGEGGERFLLLTRGGISDGYDTPQEIPYYLSEMRKRGGESDSEWTRSLPLKLALTFGPGKPFLARGDDTSESYCSIGTSVRFDGRRLGVEISCVPLRFLLDPDA